VAVDLYHVELYALVEVSPGALANNSREFLYALVAHRDPAIF